MKMQIFFHVMMLDIIVVDCGWFAGKMLWLLMIRFLFPPWSTFLSFILLDDMLMM